jgi:uncharacterized protein (TIGR03084 family)
MSEMDRLLADLAAEQADLDRIVAGLDPAGWDTPTPAEPWTVRDQISHLAFFDEAAALSATDEQAFAEEINRGLAGDLDRYLAEGIERGRSLSPERVLEWWRTARRRVLEALAACPPDRKLPWYGPPMRARSSAAARMMETWAHGQDVVDALGVERPPTDRLFHVADLGVRTFGWSFSNRGLEAPAGRVRVALRGPSGTLRVWNDEWADSITGPVEEFCLVVAQRRHYLDTHLVVEGDLAGRWMEVAQVFAGPPGPGRPPAG